MKHMAEAPQVAGSTMSEQACSHDPDLVFHAHSGIAEQAACVAARNEHRMMQLFPFAWHMY